METPNNRPRKSGYIPSLDGWRAIAVVGVMIAHDMPFTIFGHEFEAVRQLGAFGVELFFAISGYLITTRILEEERLCGFFDIKRFYIRRVFRIQPAALAYLAVVLVMMLVGLDHERWRGWLASLFMVRNFAPIAWRHDFTGHFWTLGVEEQFYILLSVMLFVFRKKRVLVLIAMYCVALGVAFLLERHAGSESGEQSHGLWELHYLLLPSVIAAVLQIPQARRFVERVLRPWAVFVFVLGWPLLHIVLHELVHRTPLNLAGWLWPMEEFLIAYGFLLFILSTATHPRSWTTRVLEMKVPRFLGRISYSLYLWHILYFLPAMEPAGMSPLLHALSQREVKWVLSIATATLSYYLIEKPLVRKGHMLAPPATAGRPELADLPVETRA